MIYHFEEFFQEIFGLLAGILIFVISIRISRKRQKLINSGRRVKATIYDIEQSEDGTLYFPVIRFITVKDAWITKRYPIGKPYGTYNKGTLVTVIYQMADPENFVIDDMRSQLLASILTVVGVITIVLSIAFAFFFLMI